jgi:hypothetical protein
MQCALFDPFIGSCKQDCWYLEQSAFEVSSLALKGIELFKNATRDVSASDTLARERGRAQAGTVIKMSCAVRSRSMA